MRNHFSRRTFLKTGSLAVGALAVGLFPYGEAESSTRTTEKGADAVLIVYYSRTGNTRHIANIIHEKVGGDIVELKTVTPYPDNYDAVVEQAKQELKAQARPPISTEIPNMASYGTVFIGYPNWWNTMPMPVFTFLEKYDFAGKKIIPFCTHGGSRLGRSEKDIKQLCPRAQVLEGLEVSGTQAATAQKNVDKWLHRIGVLQ